MSSFPFVISVDVLRQFSGGRATLQVRTTCPFINIIPFADLYFNIFIKTLKTYVVHVARYFVQCNLKLGGTHNCLKKVKCQNKKSADWANVTKQR